MGEPEKQTDAAPPGAGGISMTTVTGQLKPPGGDPPKAEGFSPPTEADISPTKQTEVASPMTAAIIKAPLRFEGNILKELTGFDGWMWTDEELEEVGRLFESCGFTANPMVQIALLLMTLHMTKAMGWVAIRRSQRQTDSLDAELPHGIAQTE